jgi:O-antigen/teichoic acid export membrane protein
LVFPQDVAGYATQSMQLLALGFGAFAIFGILTTVLTSLERERSSAAITGLAFLLVSILGAVLLRARPFDASLLFRTAIATSTGLLLATLVAAHRVHRHAGGVVSGWTLLRGVAAIAVTVTLGRIWSPEGKLATLGAAAVLGALHVGLLVALRELTTKDLGQVLSVLRGRRAS